MELVNSSKYRFCLLEYLAFYVETAKKGGRVLYWWRFICKAVSLDCVMTTNPIFNFGTTNQMGPDRIACQRQPVGSTWACKSIAIPRNDVTLARLHLNVVLDSATGECLQYHIIDHDAMSLLLRKAPY